MLAAALIATLLSGASVAGQTSASKSSTTTIGPKNPFLADGSHALLTGDFLEGVRLTEIGLEMASSDEERAAAYSNLCAGNIRLEQFELALEQCDRALEIEPRQWRAHSNRANVLLNLGRLDEAEAAVEKGLEIRPKSRTLLKVLDAARLERYDPTVTISDDP